MSTPFINCESVNPGFIVSDIGEAVGFYSEKLGFRLDFTWGSPPHFAGMTLGNVSVHLMTNAGKGGSGMAYFSVEDVDAFYRFHQENKVEITEPIADRPYHMRDYQVRDPYGNYLGFGHYIITRTPSLPVDRVDVPVRIEKRLAALLEDLAMYKGLTVSGTLEEMLLHSFEPCGDGVASPHTKSQLRYINELKIKHGIDYDVHASYRFTEDS
ncbi:MAG TPA: VOC family protein [Niabella sp.]|nr:VOC family protein [Niabella sp.]